MRTSLAGAVAISTFLTLLTVQSSAAAPADLDATFDADGIYTDATGISDFGIVETEIQPDGKILTSSATTAGLTYADIRINRYNTDGTPDITFDGDGLKVIDLGGYEYIHDIIVLDDGRILMAGNKKAFLGRSKMLLIRLETDGDLDPTFGGGDGWVAKNAGYGDAYAYAMALRPDGKIILAGQADGDPGPSINTDFALARFRPAGRRDRRFGFDNPISPNPLIRLGWTTQQLEAGGLNEKAVGVWPQPGGRILAAGQTQIGLDIFFALARFNSLGFVDTSFATNGHTTVPAITTYADVPSDAVRQADGKILIAGTTLFDDGITQNIDFAVARLNVDGSLDSTFAGDGTVAIDFSIEDDANSIALDECGRILLAGGVFNGADDDLAITRLEPDGTLDATFGTGGWYIDPFGTYYDDFGSVAVQPADGAIVASGVTVNNALSNQHTTVIERLVGGGTCVQPVP